MFSDQVVPLLDIATMPLADHQAAVAWQRWRSARPNLDDVSAAEVIVLPAAWDRVRMTVGGDVDAARLDGLRRNAALTTAITVARLAAAQSALRDAGVSSVVTGGLSVVLLGAASPERRAVRGADLWVAQSDFAPALAALGVATDRWRRVLTARVRVPSSPGLVLRSRLPAWPPLDARALVAARQRIDWSGSDIDVLGPTEAVFVDEVLEAARRVVGSARLLIGRGGDPAAASRIVGQELDRRLLERVAGFSAARLQRLRRLAGLRR